jgi:CelD/BcsL family acetyltransferase involved in cellulose biosynthesis
MSPEIVLAPVDDFDFASEEYRALFQRSRSSPFQHPDWLSPFYRILAPSHGAEPLIIVGRRLDTGALALVVPLVRRRTGEGVVIEYAFLGVTDYALPVIDPELTPADDDRLAQDFVQALGAFDRMEIAPVRRDELAAWRSLLPADCAPLGFGAHHLRAQSRLDITPKLARKIERLEEQGSLTLEVAGPESIPDAIAAARRFRLGRFRDDPMHSAAGFEFYVAVAARGQRSGLARTYRLSCGGDPVAVLFGLVHHRRFHYLVLGCDYPKYGRFSPGMIMFAKVMDHWFDGGGEIFDFTIGDEAFKIALGCERTPMHHVLQARHAAVRSEPAMAGSGDA